MTELVMMPAPPDHQILAPRTLAQVLGTSASSAGVAGRGPERTAKRAGIFSLPGGIFSLPGV